MPTYHAFGGTLESEIEFPELQPSAVSELPDWRLRVSAAQHARADSSSDTAADAGEPLGEDQVDVNVVVRSYRTSSGFRLRYEDTGVFDVSRDGRELTWTPAEGASADSARMDVLGRVLAVALHAAGRFTLHGSGVAIGGRAIGFLAPKFSGKSTLALALVKAGAELLTDDTLPVDLAPQPNAWPGVHSARLFQDSAQRLELVDAVADPAFAVKHTLSTLSPSAIRSCPAPLAALYLLSPIPPDARQGPVERTLLSPQSATVELIGHAKVGALLRRSEAISVLERASIVASRVPVYRLGVVRDFAHLEVVVRQLLSWHSNP